MTYLRRHRNVGREPCTPKTMNAIELYLLLLALFIVTSILNANFFAQTISEINRQY